MSLIRVALLLALCLAASGCVRIPGGVAPSNIPLSQGGYTVLGPAVAQDCKINLLGLIPISGGNHVADAIKRAQAEVPGSNALVNITVDRVTKYFILWSQTCTEVRALAVTTH